ncbi:MAG TPA: ATP-binding protein [Bryobacterales bacterium]|nr:ATP-binding protein [Bryobacterales bacterium]
MSHDTLVLLLVVLVPSGVLLALATWRFRRKSADQQRQLSSLYSVAENMISATDPSEVYQRIVRILPGMLNATHCYLLLHNRATKNLDVLAGTDRFPAASLPMDEISGPVTCFKNKALLEAPDAASCPFVDRAMVERLGQQSLLFVPMISEGEVFGVLEIDDRRQKRNFSNEQKAQAQHVANLGALAMKLCEQRSMREQLYRTEKMAAVGELISGVAHELKNPLASLTGLSELALARHGPGPLAEDLRAIHTEARHANSILQRLISFARPQRSGPAVVDINAVLRAVMAIRAEKWQPQGIRVHAQLCATPPMVASDQSHLEQVFLNLLINAERALEGSREKVITVRTTVVTKRVLIYISDTGPLFGPDLQSRVYHPFFDGRKPIETAGLGLTLCQSLIEGHGGSIRVSNSPGQSTTFEIEYPLAEGLPRAPSEWAAPARAADARPLNLTALVIDEDRKVQDSLLSLLSDRQYRVITVSSAEEALDLAERARFDLVLCDVRMRGLSGIELYGRMQGRIRSFVFLTTESFSGDIREMFSEPNQAVLAKPFSAADVERLLEQIEPQLAGANAG